MSIHGYDSDYLNFDLSIWAQGKDYSAKVTDSPAGTSRTVPLPRLFEAENALETVLLRLENSLLRGSIRMRGPLSAEEKTLQDFGDLIFETIFRGSPEISDLYASSKILAKTPVPPKGVPPSGLRINLSIETPDLTRLPWEYLYDRLSTEWLGLQYASPIIRYLDVGPTLQPLAIQGPLNVLGMIANPGGEWEPIDAERERYRIDKAIEPHQRAGRINFCWAPGSSDEHLLAMMRHQPWHVFHFVGHGGVSVAPPTGSASPNAGEGFIVLTDAAGSAKLVPASDLKVLLDSNSLRLVVLNCCDSARPTGVPFGSPGAALVKSLVPAVVAMQFPISDEAAIQLGSAFYESLADNSGVEYALTYARKMIQRKSRLEWGIPILYTRPKTSRLFSFTRASAPPASPSPARPQRGSLLDAKAALQRLYSKGSQS